MKYIVEGWTITNRLLFLDGRIEKGVMGGGGFYAYTAVKMCTDDCLFVSSVGKDFDDYYGDWFKNNNASKDGLFYQLDKTVYNDLKYFPDGSYIEYSIYGKKYTDEQLADMRKSGLVFLGETDPDELKKQFVDFKNVAPFMDDAKGIYTATALSEEHTQLMLEHKKNGCRIMWELPATSVDETRDVYANGGIEGMKHYLRAVDMFSLNRNEASIIFGVKTDEEILPLLKALELPIYYRVGTDGAYMIVDNKDYFVPMISTVDSDKEIDPTGCGNTSTAASMWAWFEGKDPLMTCIIGNVIASYNVRQYGPYVDMSEKTRKEFFDTCDRLYKEYMEKM